ncbi:MAG TPA: molybdopterin-dependent oxidoreductase [Bacteroidota bacterium]|nr:molybdopterin-dependent oxidoreductase [Bacteroidota bacterium]
MHTFTDAERAVHDPPDRSFHIRLSRTSMIVVCAAVAIPIIAAWLHYLIFGLTPDTAKYAVDPALPPDPHGFPGWIRLTHLFNFFFITLLARSGLSILVDHPRLYWNHHCTPGTEWIRFTPISVPTDRLWTAKDDARYVSPWAALPGYRHTIGMARSWHFFSLFGFLLNGIIFVTLLFFTDQWLRLVPTTWEIFPRAWNTFVHYATFHMPVEPNGFYYYNPLQQLGYFAVIFVMVPLSMLTGMAMSPALDNRFTWFPLLFGGRQAARSLHFILLIGYLGFIIVHVSLVAATGFARNMNHIVMGTDDLRPEGLIIGLTAIGLVVASWVAANAVAWKYPRSVQLLHRMLAVPFLSVLDLFHPRERYTKSDISPFFWPNGKMPESEKWKHLAENEFKEYRLKIGGMVEHPVLLSLDDLRRLERREHISLHHCIQGWSGIAHWAGVPMRTIIDLVKPKPGAGVVAFYSFGEGLYGGTYYDTQPLDNVLKSECLLAYEMNYNPLPQVYGAPLRLRVENHLGYKMVKWIESIEFVANEKTLGEGQGGKNEDDEYFDLLPNI